MLKNDIHPELPMPLALLLPAPDAEAHVQSVSENSDLTRFDDHSIDILLVTIEATNSLPVAVWDQKLADGGVLCLLHTPQPGAHPLRLFERCRRELSARGFRGQSAWTFLPDARSAKLMLPVSGKEIAFALSSTLNYRHPCLHALQGLAARLLPMAFFVKTRMTNFTIIAHK
ncbi:MAG: hypothetical protein EOM20_17080 [Spartobacteria bacterium]|nr:hypothetical protein [Spartobacteria bacterium]